jgi:quinolinate synthase
MKRNTLEKIFLALKNDAPALELDEGLRLAALKPLEAMMALG